MPPLAAATLRVLLLSGFDLRRFAAPPVAIERVESPIAPLLLAGAEAFGIAAALSAGRSAPARA
ncbi:hypothetical protein [Solimonas flava]|uniref:hypothetical protein n=1 Tax=Solimonas flava TaxID=415849 RepID=UPI0004084EDF|nr:hypothetical protein [Solimonas flava]